MEKLKKLSFIKVTVLKFINCYGIINKSTVAKIYQIRWHVIIYNKIWLLFDIDYIRTATVRIMNAIAS